MKMREIMRLVESTSTADIRAVLLRAREMGFNGFGGLCGEAAVAINRVLFQGKGELVGAFNRAFLDHEHLLGHIAVSVNGVLWDADAQPKTMDDIEHWGMLDPHDPDYEEQAIAYGIEWNDETANDVQIVTFDSDAEVLKHFGSRHLAGMVDVLTKASSPTR
jgi:hypothetical protein